MRVNDRESGGGLSYRIEIPGWRPALLNELLKVHHMKAAQMKRKDANQLATAKLVYGVPDATVRRRVRFEITGRYTRFPDPDAPLKSALDALKTAHLIIDDSDEWCDWMKPVYAKGPKGTVVILEDLS